MTDRERRNDGKASARELRAQLNEEQRFTLAELERFGWELKFIRKPPFQTMIPVVFDGDRKNYAIIREDGTLDENPDIVIRD